MDPNFVVIARKGKPDFVCRIDGFADRLYIESLRQRIADGQTGQVTVAFAGGMFVGRIEDITDIRAEAR
jgi:hypothetical protein